MSHVDTLFMNKKTLTMPGWLIDYISGTEWLGIKSQLAHASIKYQNKDTTHTAKYGRGK